MNLVKIANWVSDGRVQIVAMILIWWAIREHTPRGAGLSLIRPYFIYYLLGIGFYKYLYKKLSFWIYLAAWPIFIGLIPFWSRTAGDNFVDFGVKESLSEGLVYVYAGLVALSGAFIVVGFAKWLSDTRQNLIKSFLILCGQLSLGIYAIHYFFLQFSPKVIAPLLISVTLAYGINKIPGIMLILLGEK